ncbi:hypothetical protein JCM9279_001634 [Rhodotorula babjevae]
MDWTILEPQLAHPDNDKRIHALHALEQLLRQSDQVTDADNLAAVLRPLVKVTNAHVSAAALACLAPLFPLVVATDPSSAHSLRHILALLLPLDRLGDTKPTTRDLVREALVSAARAALTLGVDAGNKAKDGGPWTFVERGVQEHGFASKNPKAREQALHFLAAVRCPSAEPASRSAPALPPLRPFTPLLLPLLADPDPAVRALALSTTLAVFSHPAVSPAAKADLKKELARLDVAKKVQEQVLAGVLGGAAGAGAGAGSSAQERSPSRASDEARARAGATSTSSAASSAGPTAPARRLTRSQAASASASQGSATSNSSASTSAAPPPPSLLAPLPAAAFPSDPSAVHAPSSGAEPPPVYLASEADLRAEFGAMHDAFAGKETEHNWVARDGHVARMRGMLRGGVARGELREAFAQGVREVQGGIMRTSASLRTTLAISALTLISDLFTSLPPALLDPLVDPLLTHVLSMSGMTKKIVATASQHTATVVLTHAPLHLRAVQLVAQLGAEKTPQARLFGAQHVLTLLRVHGASPVLSASPTPSSSSSAAPSSSAADELEHAVARALADPNAQVREQAREAYWELVRLGGGWTARAERVRAQLDTTAKKLLDKARPAEVAAPAPAAGAGASAVAGGSARRAGPGAAASARRTGAGGPSVGGAGPSPAAAGAGAGAGAGPKKMSVKDMLAAKRREALAAKERGGDLLDEGVVLTPTRRSSARDGAAESSLAESATPQETPTRPQAAQRSPPASPSPAAAPPRPSSSSSPPPHTPARHAPAPAPRSLVPSHVVDDALREQALQAEQAAERLLELAEDEADSAPAPAPTSSSSSLAPPAASTPARAPPSSSSATAQPASALRTPAPNPALRRLGGPGAASSSIFADSPDARDPLGAATRGSWWLQRGEALGAAPSSSSSSAFSRTAPVPGAAREPDSAARREEIDALVERVARCGSGREGGEVDAAGWKEVGRLARERPVREREGEGAGEGAVADGEDAGFWRDEARFERVFEGLRGFLLRTPSVAQPGSTTRDMALLALKDLVENQLPCLAGAEASVFDLLFRLREDPSRSTLAATEAISTSFTARLEPLYGLGALVPALEAYLASSSSTTASSPSAASTAPAPAPATTSPPPSHAPYALALRQMGALYERLPREVLDDVLPRSAGLLKRALNDPLSPDLRRAALLALVSAHRSLGGPDAAARLEELVGGLGDDQKSLLAYYAAKRGV